MLSCSQQSGCGPHDIVLRYEDTIYLQCTPNSPFPLASKVAAEFVPPLPASKKIHFAYHKQTRRVTLQSLRPVHSLTPCFVFAFVRDMTDITDVLAFASFLRLNTLNLVFLQAVWAHVKIQHLEDPSVQSQLPDISVVEICPWLGTYPRIRSAVMSLYCLGC